MLTQIKDFDQTILGLLNAIGDAGYSMHGQMQKDGTTLWYVEEADLRAVVAIVVMHEQKAWLAAQQVAELKEQTRLALSSRGLLEMIDAATGLITADDVLAHIVNTANAHIEAKAAILAEAAKAEADAPIKP